MPSSPDTALAEDLIRGFYGPCSLAWLMTLLDIHNLDQTEEEHDG